jgi:putative hemolysin
MDTSSSIYLLILLLFLSGFFSGSETALTTLSIGKVHALEEKKKICSRFIKKLKEHPEKMLITILIGNNVVNIWASVMASTFAQSYFGSQVVGYVVGVMTLLILVFGEIVPKTLAQRFNIIFSQIASPVLYTLQLVLYPLIFLLESLTKLFITLVGKEKFKSVTEDEVIAMLNIGHEEGEFNKQENEFIRNIFEFSDTTAEEIMINRNDIEALPQDMFLEKALKEVTKSPHSRIPLFDETIDNIVGYMTVKDLLKLSRNKANLKKKLIDLKPNTIPYFPVTKPIPSIFKTFQQKRVHMAVILDEFGSTAGLVTMEDVLEEIVGDIVDETDKDEETIKKINNTTYKLHGTTPLEEVLDIHWFEADIPPHKTIAFLIIKKLGAFPREGEKIVLKGQGVEFIVEKMTGKIIQKVRMQVTRRKAKK